MMKQILVVTPNSIPKKQLANLRRNDVLVVEHPHPEQLRVIHDFSDLKGEEFLRAAMNAIANTNQSSAVHQNFANELRKIIQAQLNK